MVRARRPLRRRRPPVDRAGPAAPAGSAPSPAAASTANRSASSKLKASAVSLGNQGRTDIALGQRVFHSKFGYGTIAEIEGNKLEIDFEHAGRKRVLDSFVSAE